MNDRNNELDFSDAIRAQLKEAEGTEEEVTQEAWAAEEKKGKKLNKPFRTSGGQASCVTSSSVPSASLSWARIASLKSSSLFLSFMYYILHEFTCYFYFGARELTVFLYLPFYKIGPPIFFRFAFFLGFFCFD